MRELILDESILGEDKSVSGVAGVDNVGCRTDSETLSRPWTDSAVINGEERVR